MKSLIFALCVLALVESTPTQHSESTGPPFTVTITAKQPEVKLGDPIWIRIVLKSVSKEQFTIPEARQLGMAEQNYRITIKGADGNTVPETETGNQIKHPYSWGSRSIVLRTLNNGDEIAEEANLTKLAQIPSAGDYVVQVERNDLRYRDLHVKSNLLTIHVLP